MRTGEPVGSPTPEYVETVYPRAYGGTGVRVALDVYSGGLSPCVRGNLIAIV